MTQKKIKVLWICHFSNEELRSYLRLSKCYIPNILRSLTGAPLAGLNDTAVWNTNAVKEIRKYDDIELSIIMPYYGIKGDIQEFEIHNVHYYCFRSEDDHVLSFLKGKLLRRIEKDYKKNRRIIKTLISKIQPDIIHIMGAENPYYSIAALDIPSDVPSIVSLQTLMSEPDFKKNITLSKEVFDFRVDIEQRVIKKCTYIATTVPTFTEYIIKNINKEAKILSLPLAIGVNTDSSFSPKEYDFVYFAANIQKACDYAIEAFGLLCKERPNLTLNISGAYDSKYKKQLDNRISQLNISSNVYFTGSKATHNEVLQQIKKSRFALLPLKVDFVSSTIREAMACGLPVVTTITEGTPELNKKRECVLLSERGDHTSMAENMKKLVDNPQLAEKLRTNSLQMANERWGNERFISTWHDAYIKIMQR